MEMSFAHSVQCKKLWFGNLHNSRVSAVTLLTILYLLEEAASTICVWFLTPNMEMLNLLSSFSVIITNILKRFSFNLTLKMGLMRWVI